MKKAAFLDRDGCINYAFYDYINNKNDFQFIPGSLDAIHKLIENGYKVIIITNQGAVGKCLMTIEQYEEVTAKMLKEFNNRGLIVPIYACFHHPDFYCECRKPRPGMILQAIKEHDIDIKNSIIVGDKITDVIAGIRVGIKYENCFLVKSGKEVFDPFGKFKIFENLFSVVEDVLWKNDFDIIDRR